MVYFIYAHVPHREIPLGRGLKDTMIISHKCQEQMYVARLVSRLREEVKYKYLAHCCGKRHPQPSSTKQGFQRSSTMRFQNILLASLLSVGLSGAFNIPEGTGDGVYEHYIDSDGNDVHIKLANATNYDNVDPDAYTRSPLPGRFKRAEDVPYCGEETSFLMACVTALSSNLASLD